MRELLLRMPHHTNIEIVLPCATIVIFILFAGNNMSFCLSVFISITKKYDVRSALMVNISNYKSFEINITPCDFIL